MVSGNDFLETLNAYVDGELDPDEAAYVARRAASDPQVAALIANLQELRAGVAGLAVELGEPPALKPASRQRAKYQVAAIAAVLCLTLIGLGGLTLRSEIEAGLDQQLIGRHDGWAQAHALLQPVSSVSHDILALMSATGLSLVADLQHPGGVRQAVFKGERDCRLSLFEMANTPSQAPGELTLVDRDDLQTAEWHARDTRYVLIARRMDEMRFTTIAQSMRTATMRAPADQTDLIASLEGARQRCIG